MVKAKLIYGLFMAAVVGAIVYGLKYPNVYYFAMVPAFLLAYYWDVLFPPGRDEKEVEFMDPIELYKEVAGTALGGQLGLVPNEFDMREMEFEYNEKGEGHFSKQDGTEIVNVWADGRLKMMKPGTNRIYAWRKGPISRTDSANYTVKTKPTSVQRSLEVLAKQFGVTEGKITTALAALEKEKTGDENE